MALKFWTREEDEALARMCAEGATSKAISYKLKRLEQAVDSRITSLRKMGVDIPYRGSQQDREPDPVDMVLACEQHLQDLVRVHPERISP